MNNETDWFDLTHRPYRPGVYKTRHIGSDGRLYEGYSNYDGRYWGHMGLSVRDAYRHHKYPSPQQSREWKGLKEKS